MALLDICLTEGDSRIVQEENRGNIGTISDILLRTVKPVLIANRGNTGVLIDIVSTQKGEEILYKSLEVSYVFQS